MPYAVKHPTKSGYCPRCRTSHSVSAHRHHGDDSFKAVRGMGQSKRYKAWQKAHTRTGSKAKASTKKTTRKTTRKTSARKTTRKRR